MTTDIRELHRRSVEHFGELVHLLGPEDWVRPTPCEDWSVRDLVNHVTAEDLWTVPLLQGATIEEVGDAFDGDVLGAVPALEWEAAARAAVSAAGDVALDRAVKVSFGDIPAWEYLTELFADHLIHSWDLAVAIGADDRLDPDLVAACAAWFDGVESSYREAGVIGPRIVVEADADPQARLLARFGRTQGS